VRRDGLYVRRGERAKEEATAVRSAVTPLLHLRSNLHEDFRETLREVVTALV
jgi:hypothetical protein